ncbi:TetR/AcrR family transcriptional regulator [Albimonas sp. CAU 1670]|uniref:TetR/AcrR family transcriptional regulator n=1 Tax=Albimonas sp. CAU 1670 TaxID=3032599 RepID=UPI0023D990AF|nr:TetR/AcrR family transcriptional regulator [Albimonas sp. CAU 1670]MDF2230996.1 TetR/AcrR family transcriptional regulator [Albimonas sp. CAU 1670]
MTDAAPLSPLPACWPTACAERRCGPGRPRAYDPDCVLAALTRTFRERGYEATSVEDLISAAGLSRSSFYNAFGSKRGAMLAALEGYCAAHRAQLRGLARPQDPPAERARAVIDGHFDCEVAPTGCFIGDAAAELGARDPEVAGIVSTHRDRLVEDFAALAEPLVGPAEAAPRARAAYAIALGAGVMLKSGASPDTVEGLRQEARRLLGA